MPLQETFFFEENFVILCLLHPYTILQELGCSVRVRESTNYIYKFSDSSSHRIFLLNHAVARLYLLCFKRSSSSNF